MLLQGGACSRALWGKGRASEEMEANSRESFEVMVSLHGGIGARMGRDDGLVRAELSWDILLLARPPIAKHLFN